EAHEGKGQGRRDPVPLLHDPNFLLATAVELPDPAVEAPEVEEQAEPHDHVDGRQIPEAAHDRSLSLLRAQINRPEGPRSPVTGRRPGKSFRRARRGPGSAPRPAT